ncbi:MAG: TAXI family TRAP transporter solute-binding subunit [Haliea sp.]|nr:TAXI family TRAP transporter solute-binding subunit [Haliea sp.]
MVATEGSVANAFLIESQQARAGVIQSDVAAAAVTGQGVFLEAGPLGHLRAVASLFPEPVHIIVRADSDIDSVADLAGRRLTLGSPQSGSRHTPCACWRTPGSMSTRWSGSYITARRRRWPASQRAKSTPSSRSPRRHGNNCRRRCAPRRCDWSG